MDLAEASLTYDKDFFPFVFMQGVFFILQWLKQKDLFVF